MPGAILVIQERKKIGLVCEDIGKELSESINNLLLNIL
jgi:hypothetical protein